MKALTNFFNENKQQLESWYPGINLNRLAQEFGENPSEEIFQKLKDGIPLEYISGKAAFFHHDFEVTPDTLIPRPETETLVELALAELKKFAVDHRQSMMMKYSTCRNLQYSEVGT